MCQHCKALSDAIEAYIRKADDSLGNVLDDEGFAKSKDTVSYIEDIESGVEETLVKETKYITGEAKKSSTLEEFQKRWAKIKAADQSAKLLEDIFKKEFETCIPNLTKAYIQQTDRALRLVAISKRTTAWTQSWSQQLGEIMQLNSHTEIEKILESGLEAGQGINEFIVAIQDSGIRDEYYKARRVAVTEVLRAHSVAQQEAFSQSPSVTQKRWMHTGEYRNQPRPNHEDMDGQVVLTDEPFTLVGINGGIYYPMYPRDASLPPEESINCHCVCQPVVDESVLGLSLEERQELQAKAIAELDDEWEAELDAQNRAKAGIE